MNKTPVTILQEMMIKKKIVPKYELIYDGGGTHENIFTYQVSCDELDATGTGRCKKVAKHEAAKAMLETIAAHTPQSELPASPVPSLKRPLQTEITVSSKRARKMPFLNAVGALAQLCMDNNLQEPDYKVKDAGPPHAKIFTISCIVSTFKEEGIGATKKQAKREAARKMLEKIQVVGADLQNSDEVDLPSEKARLHESLANEMAIARYSVLSKVTQEQINLGVKLEDSRTYVKQSYNKDTRCEFLKQLNNLEEYINNAGSDVTEKFVDELREKVIKFLKPLNMTYCSKKLDTKSSKKCLVLVEVSTNPDIVEVGVADYDHQAERNGIKRILHVLTTFL